MRPDGRIIAFLDTNVLYPLISRDILFWFAHYNLFVPKWSHHVLAEWRSVMERKGILPLDAEKRIVQATDAFPDALVRNYSRLVVQFKLPDPNDSHVVAAAIRSRAHVIVTNNLKHFPMEVLSEFALRAISVDNFLTARIEWDHSRALLAFREMITNRKNPVMDDFSVLSQLRNGSLTRTANLLAELI